MPEDVRSKALPQRHESWVDDLREQVIHMVLRKGSDGICLPHFSFPWQVDHAPGEGKPKRVVNVHELAELLTLASEVGHMT